MFFRFEKGPDLQAVASCRQIYC
eukprot:SAG25_NODE_1450_length_2995_cov_6.580801_1_plen_22_part_10